MPACRTPIRTSAAAAPVGSGSAGGAARAPLVAAPAEAIVAVPPRVAARVALGVHARARLADDERIDGLEVRRVREQLDPHLAAVGVRPVVRRAQVVLDVAGPLNVLRVGGTALELGKDRLIGLEHDIGKYVEAAAMGHANNDLFDPDLGGALY